MRGSRAGPIVAVAVLAAAALGWLVVRPMLAPGEEEAPDTIETDDRLAILLAPCGFGRPFEVDTSDMVRVLVETLARGQRDAIKRAREELARMGPSVLPELARRFEASYSQAFEHGILENVLGVCTIAEEGWGIELLRRGVVHPQETVRLGAVAGLVRHGGPEDYDLVHQCIPITSTPQAQTELLTALHAIDRERFGRDYAGWLESGELEHLWRTTVMLVGDVEDPDTVARLAAQAEAASPDLRPYLLAPAARAGDAAAIEALRADLGAAEAVVRERALRALGAAGHGEEAAPRIELDPEPRLRFLSVQLVAALPPSEQTTQWISIGLADNDADVRAECLRTLCARTDPRAIAEALEALRGDARSRETGMIALRDAFAADPSIAARAFDFVMALLAERRGGDPGLYVGTLQTLSQIPGERTARTLVEEGQRLSGRIRGWRAYRWCVFHAINSGTEGRAYLRTLLDTETDPLRRLDLLQAISQDRIDEVRAILRARIDAPDTNPYERVYCASLLVEQGPSADVAPYLKRVYLATTDPVVRPALHCLLWASYGAGAER